ncbi:DUF2804 domain-containing protein [Massilia sp. Mn16-1_5]|uniref:DUF2804 domain-containing protein n=1 Tax=Massilia sp. Mn16-1_5 TaxID=2079199 RepID=UPI00109E80AF|nr:DUF2804 domain-containing protein [Massilia sp. Mn16-1_5]THC46247.1 DUF2804 domain-containing protein [Massilia sp. Mn16-1_5]
MILPPAPLAAVGPDGQPLFGRYQGLAGAPGWDRLAPPHARGALWRRLHHKRWHFVALVTEELFCGVAIVDIGWSNTAFAYVFDRGRRRVVAALSPLGVAGLTAVVGATVAQGARFTLPGRRIAIEADGAHGHRLQLHAGGFRIDAAYAGTGPRLLAVGPVCDGGSVHSTQKSPGLALQGWLEAGGRRFRLDGGVASYDFSNGLLGRRTAWRWISAHGLDIGFNLQAGYFGDAENALWVDRVLVPLGALEVNIGAGGVWTLVTDDGLLDLRFTPEGTRCDDKQLLVASSRMRQHVGRFDGWVRSAPDAPRRAVTGLAGLAEDYRARW